MWLLYAEMGLALFILVFIVWWTMKDAPSNDLPPEQAPPNVIAQVKNSEAPTAPASKSEV